MATTKNADTMPRYLNTPRLIANQLQQVVWRSDNTEPFGDSAPNENPTNLGTFTFPLRFPGQYYDQETGLSQNYFRDYSPLEGRYIQFDPIGLRGGINGYKYAMAAPLMHSDPKGLAIWICTRSAEGMPGNHRYFWDDRGSGQACGMQQFFGFGGNPFRDEKGPGGDTCQKVPGSDGFEEPVMECCSKSNKSGAWIPFVNDCYNVAGRCLDKYLPGANPGGPGRFNTNCDSCMKPKLQDPDGGSSFNP